MARDVFNTFAAHAGLGPRSEERYEQTLRKTFERDWVFEALLSVLLLLNDIFELLNFYIVHTVEGTETGAGRTVVNVWLTDVLVHSPTFTCRTSRSGAGKWKRIFMHVDDTKRICLWLLASSVCVWHVQVLAGTFRASGQMVAIKIIKKNTDEEQLSHILTEHKVLANHSRSCPFIVRLHSAFQTKVQSSLSAP